MVKLIRLQSSTLPVLQTIAWMRKQGIKPVPLHPASKAATINDYKHPSYTPPDDDLWKTHDYGVGVALGPANSGPVDCDLDCPEAAFFAPRFLPPTGAIFGRTTNPRSHYLYKVDVPSLEFEKFMDVGVKDPTIIEMRADGGHQTVMPGSIHESTGELIEWSGVPFPDLPTVSAKQLALAVRKVAIATLIVRHMWNDGFHNEPTKLLAGVFAYLDWTVDEAEDMLSAVMDYSGGRDKSRSPTIRNTFKRFADGKKVAGAGALRKVLKNDAVVDKLLEWAGSPTIAPFQEYNDRYAVASLGGKFRIADMDVLPSEQPTFYGRDDFLAFRETDTVEIDGKRISRAMLWMKNSRRRTFRSVDFMPGQDEQDDRVLNLWTGWAVLPSDSGSCAAWLELLRTVICGSPDEARWLEHWFAGILRAPRDKPMTAPVIIGPHGAGKSLLLTYFGRILGRNYTVVTNEEHIYGKFNSHLATTLLLHSEEALHGGEKRHRGIIKSLITDETLMMELKGIDAKMTRNYIRLIMTSNEDHAAPTEFGDRRFTVIDMSTAGRAITPELRDRVLDEMNGDGPAALHHHFTTMEFDPTVARTNIKSESLGEMKVRNSDPFQAWWHGVLESGYLLPDYLKWATKPDDDDWPPVVGTPALYAAMCISYRDRNVRSVPSIVMFSQALARLVGVQLDKQQRRFSDPLLDDAPQRAKGLGDRQQSIINLPSLADCREAFARHIGQQVDWPVEAPVDERSLHERF